MRRRPDWRGRLAAYIAASAERKFRPGQHDCALFAAGAVEAMTGQNLAGDLRGYRTLNEGYAMLAKRGFKDHVALAADLLPEVAPLMAQVGDLASVSTAEHALALGVVQGPFVYVLRPDGLGLLPLTMAQRAFRV